MSSRFHPTALAADFGRAGICRHALKAVPRSACPKIPSSGCGAQPCQSEKWPYCDRVRCSPPRPGKRVVSGICEPSASLQGEVSLAHQGLLFLGEIRKISDLMKRIDLIREFPPMATLVA